MTMFWNISRGEWSWGTSLLVKSGVLGMGIAAVCWTGWPPSSKSEIRHAFPSVVRPQIPVTVFSPTAFSPERPLEPVTKKSQKPQRLVAPVAKLVDLNVSSRRELEALPGIGPVLADRIVTYRSTNGEFHQIAELGNVVGIGAKRLQRLQPFARVEGTIAKLGS